ncbi:MAG: hypothetical protein LBG80_12460 [Bacteroidales bacterium]|nr:hypothetical protein [Bacteroidales bacterium]
MEEKLDDRITVKLNCNHKIFSGHFPDNPILPGVCALQIAKELLQKSTIAEIGSIRYFYPINPNITCILVYYFAKDKGQINVFDENQQLLIEIKKLNFK